MAIKGKFTLHSSKVPGSYAERTFTYNVEGIVLRKEFQQAYFNWRGQTEVKEKDITEDMLLKSESIYLSIKGGSIDGTEYRYLWGPVRNQKQIEEYIAEIYTYGSNGPLG